MTDTPELWVLAGANGSGKSTFYHWRLERLGLPFVNADEIARSYGSPITDDLSWQAATEAALQRDSLIREGRSFCTETVFSHPSKLEMLMTARRAGYLVTLIYCHLEIPALNEARVDFRVKRGGHPVPVDKIHQRYRRTYALMADAVRIVDRAWLFDNSSYERPFRTAARIERGSVVEAYPKLFPWVRMLMPESDPQAELRT